MTEKALKTIATTLLCGVVIFAFLMRFYGIANQPMHADEAVNASILSELLMKGEYEFEPMHYHGPSLVYTSSLITLAENEKNWESLNAGTLRMTSAIAGGIAMLLPMMLMRRIGIWGSLGGCALIGTSPLLGYYSRVFIHEPMLMCLGGLTLIACWSYAREGKLWKLGVVGGLLGLMALTKETFVIAMIGWGVGLAYVIVCHRDCLKGKMKVGWKEGVVFTGVFLLVIGAGYGKLFSDMGGVLDFVKTYFVYQTVGGHEKGWFYYWEMLGLPHVEMGMLWFEGGVLVMSIAAVVMSWRSEMRKIVMFLCVSGVVQILVYSCIGYKTPWLMMLPWGCLCAAGGMCLSERVNVKRWVKGGAWGVAGVVLALQSWQLVYATQIYPVDARNPYAYVATSMDVFKFEDIVAKFDARRRGKSEIILVGQHFWPLPWYMRGVDQVKYVKEMGGEIDSDAIYVLLLDQMKDEGERLEGTHHGILLGLRHEYLMMVYLPRDAWEAMGEGKESGFRMERIHAD